MSRFVSAVVSNRSNLRLAELRNPRQLRVVLTSTCSIVVLAAMQSSAKLRPLLAADQPPAGASAQAGSAPLPACFVAESRATLKRLHERMADLAMRALSDIDRDVPSEGDVARQNIMVESAKAGYAHAVLRQEASQIALQEYQAAFRREKKSCEAQISLARAELESAEQAIPRARERYAKFTQVKTGSAADLSRRGHFESGEAVAKLKAQSARLALDQAESKLRVLVEYEKPRRENELKSTRASANSEVLARDATLALEESNLVNLRRIQGPVTSRLLHTDQWKQTLALLDRASPVEQQLSARLDQIKEDKQPADSRYKEITELTFQLQGIVDQAESREAVAALARLRLRLRRAARR